MMSEENSERMISEHGSGRMVSEDGSGRMISEGDCGRIRTLIFDWDGTLHNTLHLYGSAVRSVYSELVRTGEAPEHWYSDEDLSIYLGMNARDMWASFMPGLPEERRLQMSRRVGQNMISLIRSGEASLYSGTEDVLERLHRERFRIVLLSNCTCAYMEEHRQHFHLDRWFDGYYPCEAYDNAPKEDIFLCIREDFEGNYCIIGDRESDLKTAQTFHLPSIACTWGFGTPEEYAGADILARSVTELPAAINHLQQELGRSESSACSRN